MKMNPELEDPLLRASSTCRVHDPAEMRVTGHDSQLHGSSPSEAASADGCARH